MADTQHNLRIKATLDTSQLQQEIDRLNQTGGQGSAGAGGAQSTTRILNKLDSTLNRLNSVINRLADVVGAKNYGRLAPISLPPLALPFDRMNNDQFYSALG